MIYTARKEIMAFSIILYLAIFTPVTASIGVDYYADYRQDCRYKWLCWSKYVIIREESQAAGIDYRLMLAIIDAESGGKVYARSHAGAIGLCQIMPRWWWKNKPVDRLYNPRTNIRIGCRLMRRFLNRARGNIIHALRYYEGSYNGSYIARIINNYYGSVK
jgi:soluble lytic murein transglycosylase-like protein